MGPKAKTSEENLQFVLQCLHSIRDEDGKCRPPNWKTLEPLLGLKSNSLYVRYREISNHQRDNGVPHLEPVGTRAIEAARVHARDSSRGTTSQYDVPSTSVSTPTTSAPTVTSSPVKESGKKRKRAPVGTSEEGDEPGDEDERGQTSEAPAKKSKLKETEEAQSATASFAQSDSQFTEADFGHSFLNFGAAAGLLAVDERHRLKTEEYSDADAEGESDGDV